MKWDACMFCQEVNSKFKVSMVTTMNMSNRILAASKYDQNLSVHLASVSDLIAEGRYHTPCYMKFLRKTTKTKGNSSSSDLAMEWLLDELTCTANIANVYELSEVWNRYCVLAEIAKVTISPSYLSRRSTFKEKLQQRQRNTYEFINLQQEILLVPVEFGHVPLSILLSEPKEHSLIPKYTAPEGFMELIQLSPAAVVIGKKEPGSIIQTKKEWYNEQLQDNPSACVALAKGIFRQMSRYRS